VAGFGLLSSGCAPADTLRENVIVFVIDTLRRDHLGCYGHPRDVSPVIDGLASEGVLFEQALTVAPRTWQSFTSILTGLYPPNHGVRHIFGRPLPPTVPTMASVLAEREYRTAAFDGMTFLRGMTGSKAFHEYVDPRSLRQKDPMLSDEEVVDSLLDWLSRAGEPFFAFLRLSSPHWTYVCAPVLHGDVEGHAEISHGFNAGSYGLKPGRGGFRVTDEGEYRKRFYEYDPSPKERDHMLLHYDECVRASDTQIGRAVDHLRALGVWDSTLVVVTSDHGESFGEHGYMQHGPQVDGPVMWVPLVMRFPPSIAKGRRGARVPQLVRTVDIFPTVVSALGLETPPGLDGADLIPGIDDQADLGLTAYGESGWASVGVDRDHYLPGVAGKWRMFQTSDWKLVFIPDGKGGISRLYDLKSDPGETRDVAESHSQVVARLRTQLAEIMATERGSLTRDRSLTEEQKQRLRALGYL
jgi:arylsulfatase A-like enzyme